MNVQEESMAIREPRVDATKHEFEQYPFGSIKRLIAAYAELTGIDLMKTEDIK